MTKNCRSIRDMLDEELVGQLTAEIMEPPAPRGVLFYRIALAAACVALLTGVTLTGLWLSHQAPEIGGPGSALSAAPSSPPSSGVDAAALYEQRLTSMLPPVQTGLPASGRRLPVYTLAARTNAQMEARMRTFAADHGLSIRSLAWEDAYFLENGDLQQLLIAHIEKNEHDIEQLTLEHNGSIRVSFTNKDYGEYSSYSAIMPPCPPVGMDLSSLPLVPVELAEYYYEQYRFLYPMDDIAVESYTTGHISYADDRYAVELKPTVVVYPRADTALDGVASAGLHGMKMDIDRRTGMLTGLTIPPDYADAEKNTVPVISEEEAVALWESGTYLYMSNYGPNAETPLDRRLLRRVRLEYWEQENQTVRMPVYVLYCEDTPSTGLEPGECADLVLYCVPAVSQKDADWNDLKQYINDGYVVGTWAKEP